MNERITPSNITKLKENEIFVFGSNSNGVHNGNAAATAMKFGAIMGQAVGIQGQTYALPSKHIENLKKHIDDFLLYAEQHSEYGTHRSEAVQAAEFRLQQMLQFPDGFLAGQASADRFLQEHTLLKWNVRISGYICKRTIRSCPLRFPSRS